MNPLNFKFLQVPAVLFYAQFSGRHFRSFDMQQKKHRSISLMLF